jgi:hypothetical protein
MVRKAAPKRRSVVAAVDFFLAALVGLDPAGEARAAIARSLAVKLEQAETTESGAVAQASAGIARALDDVIDELVATQQADDVLLRSILEEKA